MAVKMRRELEEKGSKEGRGWQCFHKRVSRVVVEQTVSNVRPVSGLQNKLVLPLNLEVGTVSISLL